MPSFDFSIIASGVDFEATDLEDKFFETGCDDATIALQRGVLVLDFSREAVTFEDAVDTAMADVMKTGATVDRLEPDYLVNLSDIAKRAGLTRAAIHNYAKGHRTEGFPLPVARITTDGALWDWVEVSKWFLDRKAIDAQAHDQAKTIRALNIRLFERRTEIAG